MVNLRLVKTRDFFVLKIIKGEKAFSLNWYNELGWGQNPFDPRLIHPAEYFFVNCDAERTKVNEAIINKRRLTRITGELGTGKTIFLHWLARELRKYKRRIISRLFDAAEVSHSDLINQIIFSTLTIPQKANNFVYSTLGLKHAITPLNTRRLFHEKPFHLIPIAYKKIFDTPYNVKSDDLFAFVKHRLTDRLLILLLDNTHQLSPDAVTFLQQLLDHDLPIQIILAEEPRGAGKQISIKHKDSLRIKMPPLKPDHLIDMIRRRIEYVGGTGIAPFTEAFLRGMCTSAAYQPPELLRIANNQAIKLALHKMAADRERERQLAKQRAEEKRRRQEEKREKMNIRKTNEHHERTITHAIPTDKKKMVHTEDTGKERTEEKKEETVAEIELTKEDVPTKEFEKVIESIPLPGETTDEKHPEVAHGVTEENFREEFEKMVAELTSPPEKK